MLTQPFIEHSLYMQPSGSLNRLAVNRLLLLPHDPLVNQLRLTGSDLMSRKSLIQLLKEQQHPHASDLRRFLTQFDPLSQRDMQVLTLFAHRFSAVINTARSPQAWPDNTDFGIALQRHWQATSMLVLAGGLTSAGFGIALAEQMEQLCGNLSVISSPWGSSTALYGLAQTIAYQEDILVMDFGATGIKRAIAHRYGNGMSQLTELEVSPYCDQGLVRRQGLLQALQDTRRDIGAQYPTAISLACYLKDGHPIDYYSGIYHRLGEDSTHLASDLNASWLKQVDLGPLLLIEHDSTSAALAFQFREPAMMVTLGTGLGSAPCPQVIESHLS